MYKKFHVALEQELLKHYKDGIKKYTETQNEFWHGIAIEALTILIDWYDIDPEKLD